MKKIILLFCTGSFFCLLVSRAVSADSISLVRLNDAIINPVTAEYIIGSIERAEQNNETCIIIVLDTPGGLLNATRSIVKKILNARIPVIVYVAPTGSRAGSAGVFITLSSHIAAMAPSTNIGAAHPVTLENEQPSDTRQFKKLLKKISGSKENNGDKDADREDAPDTIMSSKIVNDTVAWIRSIAEQRGRNPEWAEKSVRESSSITEQEALKEGVIDMVSAGIEELRQALHGRTVYLYDGTAHVLLTKDAAVEEHPMTFRQRLLNVLANPNLAYILLMLGFYGLLYEVTHPGIGFPGIAGAICLIVAFFSMQTLPTNYAGVALIMLSVALFVAEVFVTSFGLLAVGGIISMVLGSLILFDSPAEYLRVSLYIIIPFTLATGFVMMFLIRLAVKACRKKSIMGLESMIGAIGEARGRIEKKGKVFIQGEIWDAESDESIEDREKVAVVKIDRTVLTVEKK